MSTSESFAPNARRCNTCDRLFPAADSVEREVYQYSPDVYERPAVRATRIVDTCPFCDSEDLHQASLCERCLTVAPLPGGDFCASCELIVETAEHDTYLKAARERFWRDLQTSLHNITGGGL